jgi:YegS/Rv2252/BmrU family lipid kinase
VSTDRFDAANRLRVLVLTSPKAGSGAGREQIPRLTNLLERARIDCRVISSIDDFREQLADPRHLDAETIVVAAGGDGTLALAASMVLQGPARSQLSPMLVPMPLGTENLISRHFGFTCSADDVCRTIRFGSARTIDSGLANERPANERPANERRPSGRRFLIMATAGFDAEVVRRLHLTRRGHIRRLSYLWPILKAMRQYSFPKIQIRIDGEEPVECAWAMVFNLPLYGGGLLIEPDARDDDGLFDVIAFRSGSLASGLRYVTQIPFGRHLKSDSVFRARGKSVTLESTTRVPFQLDGDYAGRLPTKIEMSPQSVRLLIPPGDREDEADAPARKP